MQPAKNWQKWGPLGFALSAAVVATLIGLPQAKADLVFEGEESAEVSVGTAAATEGVELAPANPRTQIDERTSLRDAVTNSASARVRPSKSIALPTQLMQSEAYADAALAEAPSKSDLMRRERVKQELDNEDMLQQRIEEARLRDERRRAQELNQALSGAVQPQGVSSEVVGTLRDQVTTTQAQVAPVSVVEEKKVDEKADDDMQFSISPRFGLATFTSEIYGGAYTVRSRFAAGLSLGVSTNSHFGLEFGYQYAEHGIGSTYANPMLPLSGDEFVLKQHIFDLAAKIHLLGRTSKVRPFIGAGMGYALANVNYDQRLLAGSLYRPRDYDMNQFLGTLTAGLDLAVSQNISVGAAFRYYTVLSAREDSPLNPYAVAANTPTWAQIQTGQALSQSGFYTLSGAVTFSF